MSQDRKWPTFKCPKEVTKAYQTVYQKALDLENFLKEIPEGPQETAMGSLHGVPILYPAICTLKESALRLKDCNFAELLHSGHYWEEVELLTKNMEVLKEDIKRAKLRGDWIVPEGSIY